MLREGCFPFGDDVVTPLARRRVSRSDAIMDRSLTRPAAAVSPWQSVGVLFGYDMLLEECVPSGDDVAKPIR
jgi:hypothetical protein